MVTFSKAKHRHIKQRPRKGLANKVKALFPNNCGVLTLVGFCLYYLAIPFAFLSWLFEIVAETSIWALIFPLVSCPVIFKANVVLEVIKAVGLSTAFVVMVHNSLDKQAFGLRYSDIIQHHFAYYWFCSAIHVAFTLGGIASGAAGASESALTSLFIVIFGLCIQWTVVHKIILSKSDREDLADQLWKHNIENQPTQQEIRAITKQLACEIGESTEYIPNVLMNRFAHAFVMFASKGAVNIRVHQISDIWAIALQGNAKTSLKTLTGEIFAACINCLDVPFSVRKSALITICGGYIVYQIQHEIPCANNVEEKLAQIAAEIGSLLYRIPAGVSNNNQTLTNDVFHYLCTIFTSVAWLSFLRSEVELNEEILRLKTLADKKECKMCIWETARAIFPVVEASSEHDLELLIEKAYNFTIQGTV